MKLHEKWKTRPKVYWCDWVELDTRVSECSITTGNGKRIMTKNDIWLMTNNQNRKWQWIMADEQWKMTNDRFYLFWACSSLSFDNENTKSQMSHLSSFSSICFFSSLLLLVAEEIKIFKEVRKPYFFSKSWKGILRNKENQLK